MLGFFRAGNGVRTNVIAVLHTTHHVAVGRVDAGRVAGLHHVEGASVLCEGGHVLAPVACVRAIAGARTAGATAVGSTVDTVAGVVVLAQLAAVRATLAGARTAGAAAVGPAVDVRDGD